MKKVKNFMNKKVISFSPEDSVFDVAEVFSRKNISGAPVVENNKVIGIISETDIVKFLSLKLADSGIIAHEPTSLTLLIINFLKIGKNKISFKKELERISKIKVRDVMNKEVISIFPEATLLEAVCMMEKHDVNRLPVIKNNRLVGIIARADLLKTLVD